MEPEVTDPSPSGTTERERGAGTIEWLGISALSVGLLVALFSALESLGLRLIESIAGQLGL